MNPTAEQFRQRARGLAASDPAAAQAIMEQAMAAFPDNATVANSAGHYAMQAGAVETAEAHFARALDLAPGTLEFALNRAIALSRLGRDGDALRLLERFRAEGEADPRYCSARANAERATGDLGAAALWYESCLAIRPDHARALLGRARVSLERGEADAVARFERSLAANRLDPEAWYGFAEALDAAGDHARAHDLARQLAEQAPHWIEVQRLFAQLRLAAGEAEFAGHFAAAAARLPANDAIALAHIDVLGGLDHARQAADIAAAARRRFPDNPQFALLEAFHAGAAGDDARAEAIFAELSFESPDRWLHEARHRIRTHDYDRAAALLDRAVADSPWNIPVWALRDCVWRLTDDPRATWLHEQPGLVQRLPLPLADAVLGEIVPLLNRLHDRSALPLGQSLRGGTQTRGDLLKRAEPELAKLHRALAEALATYRDNLPPADPAHPLLRHHDEAWGISGSWSVRLTGGGDFHTAHIHPQGIISSALYCALPEGLDRGTGKEGWLELGRPAPHLRTALEPLYEIRPEPGVLALFPSTLFHGTRPFGEGSRMTVAFDVTSVTPATS